MKSLDEILDKFMNVCCDYEGGIKVDLDLEYYGTKQAIQEWAVSCLPEKKVLSPQHSQNTVTWYEGYNFAIDQMESTIKKGLK